SSITKLVSNHLMTDTGPHEKLPQHYKFASWRHRYSGRHSDPIVFATMMKINPAIIETVM
ncbi:hypothetical protein ACUX4L_24960, partial [Salmonella enterica]